MSIDVHLQPVEAAGNVAAVPVDPLVGVVLDWPGTQQRAIFRCRTADLHMRLGGAALLASDVVSVSDKKLTHGAVAGGDNVFAVGNYVRGITSTAIGLILEVGVGFIRVIPTSGTFVAEVVNETTDGTAPNDTGDVATVSAADDLNLEGDCIAWKDEGPGLIYNPRPSTYTKIAFRTGQGTALIEIQPVGP